MHNERYGFFVKECGPYGTCADTFRGGGAGAEAEAGRGHQAGRTGDGRTRHVPGLQFQLSLLFILMGK